MTPEQEKEFDDTFRYAFNIGAVPDSQTKENVKAFCNKLLNSEREEIAKEIEGRMFPLVNIDKMPGNDSGLQKIHANAHLESAATIARSRITK